MNAMTPIETDAPVAAEPRARYCLSVHPHGFVGSRIGNYHFLFTPDLDSAHRWESPEAIEAWLRELPAGHAARLMDRQLFVIRCRMVREGIEAAWTLQIPIAEPEVTTRGEGVARA